MAGKDKDADEQAKIRKEAAKKIVKLGPEKAMKKTAKLLKGPQEEKEEEEVMPPTPTPVPAPKPKPPGKDQGLPVPRTPTR